MAAAKRSWLLAPIVLAILAVFLSRQRTPTAVPFMPGRNNTVLFMTTETSGLSNIHLATISALLENHPSIEIHYASFPRLLPKLNRIFAAAEARNPATKPVIWHELPYDDAETAVLRKWKDFDGFVTPPGFAGVSKTLRDYSIITVAWEKEEHYALYQHLLGLVETVDPAAIIIDAVFQPAGDLIQNVNRRFAFLTPNTTPDLFGLEQPWGAGFWKYPAVASGYPFPIPWKLMLHNILLNIRIVWGLTTDGPINSMRTYLENKGVKKPLNIGFGAAGVPSLLATLPEANLPMDLIPSTAKFFGPVVIDTAPADQQDPELASWLKQGPTVLVNMGSMAQFTKERTEAMVGALQRALAKTKDTQVLWKFRKAGDFTDEVFGPVRRYIENGRLRVEQWLQVDPMSLMLTGDIAVSVHHGGAGSYHEAVLAGVPQVILPLWLDLYGVARTAEYVGVGVWPGKDTAPIWEPEALADGFLEALSGPKAESLRKKASALAETARSYGGRKSAARVIAKMAAQEEAEDI